MLRSIILILCLIVTPEMSFAWKVNTHLYLAKIAIDDALDDGKVTVTDLSSGEVKKLQVDPQTLNDLYAAVGQFYAGVVGPDGYPDIATGQRVIHSAEEDSGVAGGSDAWLRHIWSGFATTSSERAFRLGFLTHAAGDMFAHSFINYYTGGPFTVDPSTIPPFANATAHVVIEGYVDKQLPVENIGPDMISISGIEGTIHEVMIFADLGTEQGKALDVLLPAGDSSTQFSVPRIFSTLWVSLGKRLSGETSLDLVNDTDPWAIGCCEIGAALEQGLVGHVKTWRNHIDKGLRAWPGVSHEVAQAVLVPGGDIHPDVIRDITDRFVKEHLLFMAGLPDVVGQTLEAADAIAAALEVFIPRALVDAIAALKADIIDEILKAAVGMNLATLKDYITDPATHFDTLKFAEGAETTREAFDRDILKLNNAADVADWEEIPALYDTVVLTKLALVPLEEVQAEFGLWSDVPTIDRHVMLGFLASLDGSKGWQNGFVYARDCSVYRRLFKEFPNGEC